jgi:hypothetical protein
LLTHIYKTLKNGAVLILRHKNIKKKNINEANGDAKHITGLQLLKRGCSAHV